MPLDLAQIRKEFQEAKNAWKDIREQTRIDQRFVSGNPDDQWDNTVLQSRKNANKPALTFGTLHTTVQSIANQARQNRPEIKVEPGDDDADPKTAEMLEGHIRQIQYDSHASVAYDYSEECAASGGIGWIRLTTEYEGNRSNNQVPRIKRVFDPLSVYPVGKIEEPDFSDMKKCFVRQTISADDYKKRFGKEPVSFDKGGPEGMEDWGEKDAPVIAEYWHIVEKPRHLYFLASRGPVFEDELGGIEPPEDDILDERDVEEPLVYCAIIDGARVLDSYDWIGDWIPLIPVLGKEQVINGKRQLISAIRFGRGGQQMLNSGLSNVALMLGKQSKSPWLAYKGVMKDPRWRNSSTEDYAGLEAEIVALPGGQVAPLPTQGSFEAPIQGLLAFSLQMRDTIKAATGYQDSQLQPSKAWISGVAEQRRTDQANLANFHFDDNLSYAQWHLGRQLIDLVIKLNDTPRVLRSRAINGKTTKHFVMANQGMGHAAFVKGHENEPHHQLDKGQYHPVVQTGPGYARRKDEERDVLLDVLKQDPALFGQYADVLFSLMDYPELHERAKLLLPPQLQQASQDEQQNIPPAVRAQLVQLAQQNAQFKQAIQKLLGILQTKQVEQEGKLHVERLKTAGNVMVEEMKHRHDATSQTFEHNMAAIEHITNLLHESELAPDPNAQPKGIVQ
jgi:hypothetical protein